MSEHEFDGQHGGHPSYEEVLQAQKITMQDVMDHMTGPVVSLIVHIVLLALLGTMIVFEAPREQNQIEVEMREVDIKEIEDIPEPPEPPEPVDMDIQVDIDVPDMNMDMAEVVVEDVAVENIQVDISIPDISVVQETNSALVIDMPAGFGTRSASGRQAAMKRYGGRNANAVTAATGRALNWLAKAQNPDGSWGTQAVPERFRAALSGLATLAFLAHGETPSSQNYGSVVLKAIQRLIPFQQAVRGDSYSHAIVVYALAEAYGLTKIPMAGRATDAGMKVIIDGLNDLGSYDYHYRKTPQKRQENSTKEWIAKFEGHHRSDLSVAGWNYQAMKAAFSAGSTVEGLPEAIDKSIELGLKKTHYVRSGGFSYSGSPTGGGGASINMTVVGTLCLQLLGESKSIQARRGMQYIESAADGRWMKCDWKNSGGWPLYRWYYQTQAIFQHNEGRGRGWTTWNNEFSGALIREQDKDGSWSSPLQKYGDAKHKEGHGENQHQFKSDKDLRIWSTAFCTLMLTVYYRFLPTYQVVQGGAAGATDRAAGILADDLGLTID